MLSRRLIATVALGASCAIGCNAAFGIDDLRYEDPVPTGSGAGGSSSSSGDPGAGGFGTGGSEAVGGGGQGGGAAGPGGAGGGAIGPKALTFHGSYDVAGNATTLKFSNVSVPGPSPDRRLILGIVANDSGAAVEGVTVDGEAISLAVVASGTGGEQSSALAIGHVPNGTTLDVDVIFSNEQSRSALVVWSATGLSSNQPIDGTIATNSPMSGMLMTEPGGFFLAVAGHVSSNDMTWSGAQERVNALIAGHSSRYTGADDGATLGGMVTIEVSGLLDSRRNMVAASW